MKRRSWKEKRIIEQRKIIEQRERYIGREREYETEQPVFRLTERIVDKDLIHRNIK